MADQSAPIGDITSCSRTQSPTGCGAAIQCASTIEACAASGCWIVGGALYLYSDASWRDPNPGIGTWEMTPARHLVLGGSDLGLVAEGSGTVDFACP